MNFLFYVLFKRYLKTYLVLFFIICGTLYSSKIIFIKLTEKNLILEKMAACDFDLVAPKGSSLNYILQALELKPMTNELLPLSLVKTLIESLKIDTTIIQAAPSSYDTLWKSDVIHFAKVRPPIERKKQLADLINKQTVAQYIDIQSELQIFNEQFGFEKKNMLQLILFFGVLIVAIIYLMGGYQYSIYKNISQVASHCGLSKKQILKNFILLYLILLALAFIVFFFESVGKTFSGRSSNKIDFESSVNFKLHTRSY